MLPVNGCMPSASAETTAKQHWQSAFNSVRFISQANKRTKTRLNVPDYVQIAESFSDVVSCYEVCLPRYFLYIRYNQKKLMILLVKPSIKSIHWLGCLEV